MHICLCFLWNISFEILREFVKNKYSAARIKKKAYGEDTPILILHTKTVKVPWSASLSERPVLWLCGHENYDCPGNLNPYKKIPEEGDGAQRCYRHHALFLSYFKYKIPVGHRRAKYLLERNININVWHRLLFSWNNFRPILYEIRFPVMKVFPVVKRLI